MSVHESSTLGNRQVFSVSELNRMVRGLLEQSLPPLWLEGEISNLSRPSSGHIYFSLKDANSQIRCAMFRSRNQYLPFRPENGQFVMARGRLSLYEARGEYQFIVEQLEETGDGALRRAFEALKARLAATGLFDAEGKHPLPEVPHRVGVITSPTGAALQDVLRVLAQRCPLLPVLIYPTPVQGHEAAHAIAEAIRLADRRQDCDVLILCRGGGSLEDLWPFNEEAVVHAISECRIPIIAGVGHEIDVTLADWAADERAPTPSAAAERISPDSAVWLSQLQQHHQRLAQGMVRRLQDRQERLTWRDRRLQQQHPARRLAEGAQRLDELEGRLVRAEVQSRGRRQEALARNHARLAAVTPRHRITAAHTAHETFARRLAQAMRHQLERRQQRLGHAAHGLEALSPLATVQRGYAILQPIAGGPAIRTTDEVQLGQTLAARLAGGRLHCTVDRIITDKEQENP